jgi:hypothetical protein
VVFVRCKDAFETSSIFIVVEFDSRDGCGD